MDLFRKYPNTLQYDKSDCAAGMDIVIVIIDRSICGLIAGNLNNIDDSRWDGHIFA